VKRKKVRSQYCISLFLLIRLDSYHQVSHQSSSSSIFLIPHDQPPPPLGQARWTLNQLARLLVGLSAACCCKFASVGTSGPLSGTSDAPPPPPPPRSGFTIRAPALLRPKPLPLPFCVPEACLVILLTFAASSRSRTAASCVSNLQERDIVSGILVSRKDELGSHALMICRH
jgi:hypothetical protein